LGLREFNLGQSWEMMQELWSYSLLLNYDFKNLFLMSFFLRFPRFLIPLGLMPILLFHCSKESGRSPVLSSEKAEQIRMAFDQQVPFDQKSELYSGAIQLFKTQSNTVFRIK
jgi:hypothetical protein